MTAKDGKIKFLGWEAQDCFFLKGSLVILILRGMRQLDHILESQGWPPEEVKPSLSHSEKPTGVSERSDLVELLLAKTNISCAVHEWKIEHSHKCWRRWCPPGLQHGLFYDLSLQLHSHELDLFAPKPATYSHFSPFAFGAGRPLSTSVHSCLIILSEIYVSGDHDL